MTLVPTNKSKKKKIKNEELQSKVRCLIRSITKSSDDYDEKYMKIKFDLDCELPLNKTMGIGSMIKVVRVIFHENTKHYPQVFWDACLY